MPRPLLLQAPEWTLDARAASRQTFAMPYSLQIVIDSTNPHALAEWWAETLGWVVEPSDPAFIRSMIDQGFAAETDAITHNGALVWKIGSAITAVPDTAEPGQPRMLFQLAAEGEPAKTAKNRVHWDVRLGGEDKTDTRARLEARGATFLWEASQGPFSWITLADPEGNEFCIG